MIFLTGMRPSEVLGLNEDNSDFEEKWIRFVASEELAKINQMEVWNLDSGRKKEGTTCLHHHQ